jgi:hypothetical protein
LAYGLPHKEALRWGPVNAGSVVMKVGPMEGLLNRKQIELRLKRLKTFQPVAIIDESTKLEVARLVAEKKD